MKNFNPTKTFAFTLIALLSLAGCGSMTQQERDMAIGAGVGAIGGSVLTGGSVLGTVGGAVIGGAVGKEVSKDKK